MTHFISESTVHEYQYSIEHFPETSSLMTSGYGTNYDFSICSRSPHSSLSLKELQTLFPDVIQVPVDYVGNCSSMAGEPLKTLILLPLGDTHTFLRHSF